MLFMRHADVQPEQWRLGPVKKGFNVGGGGGSFPHLNSPTTDADV
jgi:hypothetical protein